MEHDLPPRLKSAAFPREALRPRGDAAFVTAVMARLDEEAAPVWELWLSRLASPALGLALAASAAFVFAPSADWPGFDADQDWVLAQEVP